ncbi:MAG: HAMP domain-containing sensor histidine kinase [Gemmatimonadota bacterium]
MSHKLATTTDSPSGERRRAVLPPVVWDPDVPNDMAVSPEVWSALRSAVMQVAGEWLQVVEDAASPEEALAHLARVAAAIREAACGREQTIADVPRTVLSRRLVSLVRTHFLARVAPPAPAPRSSDLLRVLGAIETVAAQIEPDWAQHLADRLSGPDGMELVVEVAHDLRSPLTSILFLAETLQRARSGPVNSVQERQLGLIYSAAFGLSSMASDVIELARGGDRLVDLDPIPFSIADIFESVRDIVLPIAEEKGLEVRLTMPGADFRMGHPVALSRVLLNLTTNALKFTNDGYVEVTSREFADHAIEFSVRDTGRGIPPQSMATLFEPFRRRQKQGEYAFSGSGLGLSICRKLVEAMGSDLLVDTEPRTGTRFYFTLQLPPADLMS